MTPITPSQSSPEKGTEGACQDPNADPQTCCTIRVAEVRVAAEDRMGQPDAVLVGGFTGGGAHLGDSRDPREGVNYGKGKKQEQLGLGKTEERINPSLLSPGDF